MSDDKGLHDAEVRHPWVSKSVGLDPAGETSDYAGPDESAISDETIERAKANEQNKDEDDPN